MCKSMLRVWYLARTSNEFECADESCLLGEKSRQVYPQVQSVLPWVRNLWIGLLSQSRATWRLYGRVTWRRQGCLTLPGTLFHRWELQTDRVCESPLSVCGLWIRMLRVLLGAHMVAVINTRSYGGGILLFSRAHRLLEITFLLSLPLLVFLYYICPGSARVEFRTLH